MAKYAVHRMRNMLPAPIPKNEEERLAALHRLGLLGTPSEKRFDKITEAAAKRFHVPICTIALLDKDREWFKSCYEEKKFGIFPRNLMRKEGPRTISFCGHALLAENMFVVEDTLRDPRFSDNPYVQGPPHIRFYAGIALRERSTQMPIGVFCVKDMTPRTFSAQDTVDLMEFGKRAEEEMNQ